MSYNKFIPTGQKLVGSPWLLARYGQQIITTYYRH